MTTVVPVPTIPEISMYQDVDAKEESARDQSTTEEDGNDHDDSGAVAPMPRSEVFTATHESTSEEPLHADNESASNLPRIDYHALTASPTDPQGNLLRRGKWTPEESSYANRLILEFRRGTLPLPPDASITLREFLSKLLRCDPMRITKKFEGDNCLRKVVYRSSIVPGQEDVAKGVREEIRELEAKFLERLDKTKSTSSQAVADKALLESVRSEGEGKDLIDLFCEGMHREASRDAPEDKQAGAHTRAERETPADSLKTQYDSQTDDTDVLLFQQALATQLQDMQKLIQRQQQQLMGGALQEDTNLKRETDRTEYSILPFLKKVKIESNYNSAMANLLSVQRMILDCKHKLYDLEFDLCDTKLSGSRATDAGDMRERRVEALREEIERLEAQRGDIEKDIEEKYRKSQE